MGWDDMLLDDVRRNRGAYRALFAASLLIAVFAGTFVLGGAAAAGLAATTTPIVGLGLPFVAFPIGYAALVWRLLNATAPGAPQPT